MKTAKIKHLVELMGARVVEQADIVAASLIALMGLFPWFNYGLPPTIRTVPFATSAKR
ncbi:hypothetical protein J2Y67_002146 [Neobacillus niacini]|nr:hypothetical protein [Neobacillus niacini]